MLLHSPAVMNHRNISFKSISLVVLTVLGFTLAQAADKPDNGTDETVLYHINPKSAQKLVAEAKIGILDIRTPEEFKAGHIAGATNINFRAPDFAKQIAALPKSKTILATLKLTTLLRMFNAPKLEGVAKEVEATIIEIMKEAGQVGWSVTSASVCRNPALSGWVYRDSQCWWILNESYRRWQKALRV